VHRGGLWHRCFHLWVVSGGGVLLQRRAADKEACGGMLDATAAGHLTAGDAVAGGAREAEEELGVAFALDGLASLGMRPVVDHPTQATTNRELQHVFLARDDRPVAREELVLASCLRALAIMLERFSRGERPLAI